MEITDKQLLAKYNQLSNRKRSLIYPIKIISEDGEDDGICIEQLIVELFCIIDNLENEIALIKSQQSQGATNEK